MSAGRNKSAAAKFGSKNRNKVMDKEDRRLIYTKKKSKKQFDVKVVSRENLEDMYKESVVVKGRLSVFKTKEPFAPSLLTNVVVGDEYIDHVWVVFPVTDRRKLRYCKLGEEVYLTATVYSYCKRYDRQLDMKYGLIDVELIKE